MTSLTAMDLHVLAQQSDDEAHQLWGRGDSATDRC